MNSDDEQDNCNEDQIINLISALQQKIKTNRANTDLSNSIITKQPPRNQNNLKITNEFSLQGEQSKHSSISENLSDLMVRTDNKNCKEQPQEEEESNQNITELKQKMDYLIQQRERDRELLEQMNAGLMFLISQLPKPKQTMSIGVQTQMIKENTQQQQLTPNRKKTAQQTVQQMFQEPDRFALQEIRNFCFKR